MDGDGIIEEWLSVPEVSRDRFDRYRARPAPPTPSTGFRFPRALMRNKALVIRVHRDRPKAVRDDRLD